MPYDATILAFDTSAAHCAAALVSPEGVWLKHEDMRKGQADRLFPFLEELLQDASQTWAQLDALGVGVGPGNFTGIRISVAAARGLALGLEIPAIGVNTFDALEVGQSAQGVLVAGPRGHVYARVHPQEPRFMPLEEAQLLAQSFVCFGDVALEPWRQVETKVSLAQGIAEVACARFAAQNNTTFEAPAPLYLKAADAAPSSQVPPRLLP